MNVFSFSRLKLYETCPQRFYYRYVLEREEPVTKPLALGKAVHKAIELILNGTDFEEAIFEEAIKEGWIECDFHPEVEPEEIRQLVENAPFQKLEGVTEYHFRLPLFDSPDSPELQGYIDLWNGDKIMDFKTNWKPYDVTDNYQVALYAWAIQQLKGYDQVQGSLYFLRHKQESSFVFTEKETKEAVDWARKLVEEIRFKLDVLEIYPDRANELFPYKPSSACEHCPFVLDCYKNNKI